MARLIKSRDHWIDGVVGGVADYFHINPDLLRVIILVGVFILRMHFLITVYIILMILMPAAEGMRKKEQNDDLSEGTEANPGDQPEVKTAACEEGRVKERKTTLDSGRTLQIFGVLLIFAGVVYLIRNQFPMYWFRLEHFWYDFRDILDEFRTILLGGALILGGLWLLYKDKKIKKWFRNK